MTENRVQGLSFRFGLWRFDADLPGGVPEASYPGCVAGWRARRARPFVYDLPDDATDVVRKNFELLGTNSDGGERRETRVVFPEMVVRLTPQLLIGFLAPTFTVLKRDMDLVYFPRRIHTVRRLNETIYDLLRCSPDIVVCGCGMRDYVIDDRFGQPFIDRDEFWNRLYWTALAVKRDFDAEFIYLLNPPLKDCASAKGHEVERVSEAAKYMDVARDAVAAAGGTTVDLAECYPNSDELDTGARGACRARLYKQIVRAVRSAAASRKERKELQELQSKEPIHVRLSNRLREVLKHAQTIRHLPPGAPRTSFIELSESEAIKLRWPQSEKLAYSYRTLLANGRFQKEGEDDVEADSRLIFGKDARKDDAWPPFLRVGKVRTSLGGRDEIEAGIQRYLSDLAGRSRGRGLRRVMIIGDSIRMRLVDGTGYGRHAYEQLNEVCELVHVPHNCGSTKAVLQFIDDWLSARPDIVHINAGLHDLALSLGKEPHPTYVELWDYKTNLRRIVGRLRGAGCKTVLWGTSTPVQEDWHKWIPGRTGKKRRTCYRLNKDVRAYNEASEAVMRELDVPVTDMFSPLWDAGVENVVQPDGVHLNHRGSAILGRVVADRIRAFL